MNENEINLLICDVLGKDAKIVSTITGGMMNISYLVNKKNKNYIAYFPTEQANEMVDRYLEKSHQKYIYDLGITSKNIYFDPETGIKINEFIEGSSLDKVDSIDINKVSELLRKLHRSMILSRVDYEPFKRFEEKYEKEALSYYSPSPLYNEIKEFLYSYKSFLEKQTLVLCHNDYQKSNIIKDKKDNYYLIDFEFTANNDPIYDIAAYGNALVSEGRELLEVYYHNDPNISQIKRYYLWRMFLSLQWYNVAITKHFRDEGKKHNIDFMEVANHFLKNAKDAYDGYKMEVSEDMDNEQTKNLIIATLDKVRHFLKKDGGDCEFVDYRDGVVFVKMVGACQDCTFAGADIKELIEVILQEEVPGVIEVRPC